ncbi:MAG: DUF4919 domain-containing protein [Chloroflexi bacterium]|nr:DUF4919 domain-containing protein [Chloroflexota bacterium]
MDSYEKLLVEAQQNPAAADFLALRLAYTQSVLFDPYNKSMQTAMALRQALQQDDELLIGAGIQRALQDDYLDIEAHVVAHNFYRQSGKAAKAEYHAAFARGLVQSILRTDGRSFETAFEVISIREEYALLGMLGLQPKLQRKASHEGKEYDILTVSHPQTGEDLDFYFNIDLMRSYWKRFSSQQPVEPPADD